jgi:uncharacterized membrane protein YjfL (UPF0719 family)
MKIMGMLMMLIIGLFVITLAFTTMTNNNEATSDKQQNSAASSDESANGVIQGLGVPSQQSAQMKYTLEQLRNQGAETNLTYQQQMELSKLEYNNLSEQQRYLHEKGMLSDQQKHELILQNQELRKEYMLKQQESKAVDQGRVFEAEMADRLIGFETRKQLLEQQHEKAMVLQKNTEFKQSLTTYVALVSIAIFLLSLSYYLVVARSVNKQKELILLKQDHIYALKQQESMQETRIKVLESISDLPERDKKEIIVGLVGLNRPFEELEDQRIEEPAIEIELTELTPPQMKTVPINVNSKLDA